jgi:SAM-dependent methyltransferase
LSRFSFERVAPIHRAVVANTPGVNACSFSTLRSWIGLAMQIDRCLTIGRAMEPDAIRSSYDVVAETYASKFSDELSRKPFDREWLERFERECPRGRVLDIGCGPGHVGSFLASLGLDVTGIDLSPTMIDVARRLNPGMTFEVGDMKRLDHDDGSVAGIVAFYSLIHIPRAGVPDVLTEFRRALMPGGQLLIAVHGGTGEITSDDFLGHRARFAATLFEKGELARMIGDAGFTVDQSAERERYDFEAHTPRIYIAATAELA